MINKTRSGHRTSRNSAQRADRLHSIAEGIEPRVPLAEYLIPATRASAGIVRAISLNGPEPSDVERPAAFLNRDWEAGANPQYGGELPARDKAVSRSEERRVGKEC